MIKTYCKGFLECHCGKSGADNLSNGKPLRLNDIKKITITQQYEGWIEDRKSFGKGDSLKDGCNNPGKWQVKRRPKIIVKEQKKQTETLHRVPIVIGQNPISFPAQEAHFRWAALSSHFHCHFMHYLLIPDIPVTSASFNTKILISSAGNVLSPKCSLACFLLPCILA